MNIQPGTILRRYAAKGTTFAVTTAAAGEAIACRVELTAEGDARLIFGSYTVDVHARDRAADRWAICCYLPAGESSGDLPDVFFNGSLAECRGQFWRAVEWCLRGKGPAVRLA